MKSIEQVYQDFMSKGGKEDAVSFGIWLIKNEPDLKQEKKISKNKSSKIQNDSMTAILVSKIERFVHDETKMALKKIGINNPDEFALMSTLYFMGNTTKTSLLKQCVFEITTGSQMLKRLIEDEYIYQVNNPKDGRSILIQLSKKGQNKLFAAYEELNKINNLTEGLNDDEKRLLVNLLQHLDFVHSKRKNIKTIVDVIDNKKRL